MKGFVVVLLALVLAGLAAWFYYARPEAAPPPEMTEAEIAQYEAEVIQAIEGRTDAFYEAFLQGGAQAAASFWTSDALGLLLNPCPIGQIGSGQPNRPSSLHQVRAKDLGSLWSVCPRHTGYTHFWIEINLG